MCLMSSRLKDDDIEAEARSMIRKRIQDTGWYPRASKEERQRLIEQDVELHWHLLLHEAARQLVDKEAQQVPHSTTPSALSRAGM
jgi:hypothetical protein